MKYPIISILLSLTIIIPQEQIKYGLPEVHEQNLFSRTDPPANLIATGGDGEITLTWDTVSPDLSRTDVTLWISNVTENNIEISMLNTEDVYGFQFNILADSLLGAVFGEAFGGRSEEAGFSISTNPEGLVIGFSFANDFITPGDGVLTHVNWTHTGSDEFINLSFIMIGGQNGIPLSYENGVPFCFGDCIEPAVITYSIYRDGDILSAGLDITEYIDTGLDYSETHCYVVTSVDGEDESEPSNEECATTNPEPVIADSLALVTLYNTTNGDEWTDNNGWLTDSPFCEWYGVTCANGHVNSLELSQNQLSGFLPSNINLLYFLQILDLSINSIFGEIPDEIGDLLDLTILNLSGNDLTGEIPSEFGFLFNLITLDLLGNELEGEIPSEFQNLSFLENLDLSINELTGSIPAVIGNLDSLRTLKLGRNLLSGEIPSELGSLINLRELNLYSNMIVSQIPDSFGNLENVEIVILSSNNIYGNIPTTINNMTNLRYLDLQNNQLFGSIPSELFDLSLTDIYLNNNQLSGSIPPEIGNQNRLRQLNLADNYLSGEIPEEIGNIFLVSNINLSHNQLTGELPPEFGNLTVLTELNVEFNQLSGEIPSDLCNIPHLLFLRIGSNFLEGNLPVEIGNLTYLLQLSAANNQLSGEIPSEIGSLLSVEHINLSANDFEGAIPSEIGNLSNLKVLFLGNNNLFSEIPSELGDLISLEILYLSNNQFTGEIPSSFGNLQELDKLYLSENELNGSIPNTLGNLSSIRIIYLNNNQLIGQIPTSFGNLSSVEYLDLSLNELTDEIPSTLGSLTNLEYLDLSWNQLSGNIPAELGNLSNLTQIDMSHNQLSSGVPLEMGDLAMLEVLNLSSNSLTGEIPPELGGLTSLEDLHLFSNSLTGEIPPELGGLTSLEDLSLSSNSLTGEIPPELGGLTSLEDLHLSSNSLTGEIPPELCDLNNLQFLGLKHNQLSGFIPDCLCDLDEPDIYISLNNNQLCPNYPDCLEPYVGYQNTDSCGYFVLVPDNFSVEGGTEQITLTWGDSDVEDPEVTIWISNVTEDAIEVSMSSSEDVGGFQFQIVADFSLGAIFGTGYGGLAEQTGFVLSTNTQGMVIGFSLTGENIPSGGGVLTNINWSHIESNGFLQISNLTVDGGAGGAQLISDPGIPFCYGECEGSFYFVYNIYRNGDIYEEGIEDTYYIDNHLLPLETHCYSITAFDGEMESDHTWESCATTNPGTTELDSLALVALYQNTNGNDWDVNTGWLTDLPHCQWHSVTCENAGVLSISLSNDNLSGTLPPELGNLYSLRTLDLHSNSISGTLPNELETLSSLKTFNLSENQLSGSLPEGLNYIAQLKYLHLKDNQFTGDLPEGNDWFNIRTIDLSLNQFSGAIPPSYGDFNLIQSLKLAHNQLSGEIPSEFVNFEHLNHLELNNNQLSGNLPDDLTNLSELSSLNLSSNQLTGDISPLCDLEYLHELKISENQFSGQAPDCICNIFIWDHYPESFGFSGNQLCPPYPNCIEEIIGYQNTDSCDVGIPIPQNVEVDVGVGYIELSWDPVWYYPGRSDITVWVSDVTDTTIVLSIINTVSISEFYLDLDATPDLGAMYGNASGGFVEEFGFNTDISLTGEMHAGGVSGEVIPPGEGILAVIGWEHISTDGYIGISNSFFEDSDQDDVSSDSGPPFCFGSCSDPAEIGYNVYRDGLLHADSLNVTHYTDNWEEDIEYHCYQVTATNGIDESGYSIEICPQWFPVPGCTDPLALNYNPNATVEDGSCEYEILIDAPSNLVAEGDDGQITLTWDEVANDSTRSDVTLWISNATDEFVEISMSNTENVYGFQFNILADSLLGAVFGEAFGGRSEEAGFAISTNPEGLVIGFSFANDFITPGDGVLTHVNWTHTGSDEFINLSFIMIGGQNGIPLSYENGVPFCFGDCIEPAVITYSIYRDGDILSAGLDITEYIDTGLDYSETHCYVVTSVDGIDESEPSNEACATTDTEPTNTDSLALVALYNSTNGDNWTQNEGWLMDTPFCEWYGITCENGFVTQINFGGWDNNLIGEIPAELGNLMNLTELLLQFNQLAGTIPIEFGNLSNLTTLSLNSNQLTGTIPVELGNLSNLTDLSLNNNQLTGTIPVELENLSNLTDLHLHSNHLTSTIPFELGNLSNLTDLSLGGNQLTGTIPVELGNLFNLTHLSLGSNQLTGTIPVELGNLSNLTYLFIQINHLTGTIPVELGNLSNLIYLYLDSNQLTGTIPVELGNLSNLTVLWLQYNQLTGSIPLELGNLSNLTSLYLFTNQLTGEIPVELGNLTNLTRLALYSNQLTGEIPESLCNLSLNWSNSSYFNITNNQLCPPYPECMADYVGDQDVTNCGELLPAPANLIAEGGDGQITLTWDAVTTDSTRSDVTLWVSDVTNGHIEISMSNTINVYGFQFNIFLDPYFLAFYFDTYGGSAEYAGFEVSSDLFGMINGNLLTDFIPPGEGVLTNIQWFPLGNDTWVDLNVEIILGQFNLPLSYEIGEPYCYGNCDSVNMTYNVYCDGNILVEDIPPTNYTDLNLGLSETHCYTVTATDGVNESDHSNEACATTLDNLTGCTDPWALNYNPEATDDDGSCEYEEISLILDSQYTNVIQFLYFIQNDNSIQEVLSPEYFPDGMPTEIIGNGVAGNYMDGIGWVGSLTELQMNTNYFIDGWGDETISYTYPGAQLLGCTDPVAINYFPNATDDDGNCRYIGPPLNLTASAIENDIYLDWDAFVLDSSLVDVVIWISDVTEEHIEISMLNNVPLYGFQFSIVPDPEITAEFGTVYGGSAQDAGFSLSSNPIGLTLGFSFTGNSIPPGECVLVFVDWTPTGTDAWVDLLVTNFSGPNGTQLTYAAGEPFCYGNCDPLTISYTIFRDDEIFADSLFTTTFIDSGLGFSETHCYTVTAFDGTNTSDYSNEACATTFSLPGCTDPLAVNYNPQATEDDETCTYVETPLNFEVLRYGGSYCLYWDPYSIDSSLVDVVIWISDITEDHIEISLRNNVPLYGFQFATVLDSTITADYGYTYGGRAQEAGFYMATSDFGMTLGFSYSGSYIEPGEGVLLYIDWVPEGIDEYIDLIVTNFSGPMGDALTFETGDPFCFGNCQPVIITYNVYRNDELLISDLLDTEYIDSDPYQNCYYVSAYDGIYESLHTTENCPLGFPSQDPQHYIDLPEPTGEFHLVHIDDAVGLEFGDEIGLFDYNGIINSGDCSNQFGEILVGASVWSGIPSGVLSAGSIDYCGSFGVPVPGYVVGNPIYIRVWNSVQNVEREIIVTLTAGNGVWGEPQTSVIIEAIGQTALTLTLEPFMNNLISINVEPDDPSIQTVFEDNVIIASNDQGEFYVPSLNYNTIGNMDILEGYKLFTSLNEPYTFSLTGVPVEPYQTINLDPFMNNLISYLPQVPMSTFDAFGAYNNQILLVSNDQGEFYIPSYGATTLTYLYPGKGYRIFLNTDSVVEFAFPQTELIRDFGNDIAEIESYKVESVSQQYDIMKTGLSTPIVITSVVGEVVPGDELVVYAHGIVVGAARIVDPSKPILLTAWEGFHSFGVDIPGYETGDEVDIRLWKMDTNREVKVIADLDNSQFGQSPMNTGILIITSTDVVPQSWSLNRAYPNPFNPVTTIGYSIPVDGYVSIIVYNVTGRQMTQLISENTPVVAGHYSIEFHGDDLPSGLYFVVMRGKSGSEEFTARQKVVLLK